MRGCHGDLKQTMADAREETETALFTCIQHVLDRTGLKATQVVLPLPSREARQCVTVSGLKPAPCASAAGNKAALCRAQRIMFAQSAEAYGAFLPDACKGLR